MADTESTPEPEGVAVEWPPLWLWIARHRKPVILITALVVVALVGTIVTTSALTQGPTDVVQKYLDAIHSGDTEAALEIAGEPKDDKRLAFLSADALADDWSVDAVVERHRVDDEADVDVTISAGNTTQQGRFHVVDGEDGWTIESPFVRVDLTASELGVVELGDVRKPAKLDQTRSTVPLLLFPGVYDLYPSFAKRATFTPSVLIATPQESTESTLRFTTTYTLTDAGADAAQKAIDALVDKCATVPALGPPGCPFSGEETSVAWELTDRADLAWKIETRPEAHFVVGQSGALELIVRKPGTVRLTGSGVPDEPAGSPRTTFALTCEFGLDNLTVALTPDGFVAKNVTGNEYAASLATECF